MNSDLSRARIGGLDGLRALAVSAVVLFHSHLAGTELGWVGVELFFVISGFLITRILLESRERPGYLRVFYTRRALRILPLYYFVLLISTWLATTLGRPLDSLQLPFYAVYLQNYFPQIASQMSAGIPLTSHTWTLAVEEQFYWLWPLVILVITGRRLKAVVIACLVGAPLARLGLLLVTQNPYAALTSLPAQVDALAAGAYLALAERDRIAHRTIRRLGTAALIAGALLVAALVGLNGLPALAETSLWAARPVNVLLLTGLASLFFGVVALTAYGTGPWLRLLGLPPLTHIGRISYGIYIYNPLALLAASLLLTGSAEGYLSGGLAETALGAAITYGIALTSWRFLETPLLRLKARVAAN